MVAWLRLCRADIYFNAPELITPPPGVSRRQGISRSQLLSSWSRVWIYMLAGRAPHKSKLVVWALSGAAGRANRHRAGAGAGIYRHRADRPAPAPGTGLVSFTVASSVGTTEAHQWAHQRHQREVSSHQLVVSDTQWGHPVTPSHPDLQSQSGNGDIKRWDPLTQW